MTEKFKIAILIVNGGYPPKAGSWLELCLQRITNHSTRQDFCIFLWDNNKEQLPIVEILSDKKKLIYLEPHPFENLSHQHAIPLERLWQIARKYKPDYLVTMDTDAFPIKDGWLEVLIANINRTTPLTGIWRDELSKGISPYIHPSCLCIKTTFLDDIPFRFDDLLFQKPHKKVIDTASSLTEWVKKKALNVYPIKRSNSRNFHHLFGGIYGDFLYHHGAGSRINISFWDTPITSKDHFSENDILKEAAAEAIHFHPEEYLNWLRGKSDFEKKFEKIKKTCRRRIKAERLIKTSILAKIVRKIMAYKNKFHSKPPLKFDQLKEQFSPAYLIPIPKGWQKKAPDFVGIGVPKAGTTWLNSLLLQHPQVLPHRVVKENKNLVKELHYFNHQQLNPITNEKALNYQEAFLQLPNTICGEFSTDYLHHPGAINALKFTVPNSKIIICLRSPIDRTYSHINHLLRNRAKRLNISEKGDLKLFYLKHDALHYAVRHSYYYDLIQTLLLKFPANQVHILLYEQLVESPINAMNELFHFLGIEKDLILHDVSTTQNHQPYRIPPINEGQYEELRQIFKQDVLLMNKHFPELNISKYWPAFFLPDFTSE